MDAPRSRQCRNLKSLIYQITHLLVPGIIGMYAVNCVVRLSVEERGEIHESDSLHQADALIQRSPPNVIESDGRVAGWRHPGSWVRGIIGVDSADDYLDALCGGHSHHTLQVVSRIAGIALKKIIPPSHDHNGFGRRDLDTTERESIVVSKALTNFVP
jgi:hypothetical protein